MQMSCRLDQKAHAAEGVLLQESYRRFARVMGQFSDFDSFCSSLEAAVREDPLLQANFIPAVAEGEATALTVDDLFLPGEVVLPMTGEAEGSFYRVSGRRDERPFGAEDLQLMGATADFIAALFVESKRVQQQGEQLRVLQFLVDQLPVGVVCQSADGAVIMANKLAWRQLGVDEQMEPDEVQAIVGLLQASVGSGYEGHFEVDGALMFAACRRLSSGGGDVCVYVLYDLRDRRAKLQDALERAFFRCKERAEALCVALVASDEQAGVGYRNLKSAASALGVEVTHVQPLDAYTTACLFVGLPASQVRRVLYQELGKLGLQRALVGCRELTERDGLEAVEAVLHRVRQDLKPVTVAFLPVLVVLDAYPPVADTFALLLDGLMRVEYVESTEALIDAHRLGVGDFYVLDLDGFDSVELKRLIASLGPELLLYTSVRSASMLARVYDLGTRGIVLQKPFESRKVLQSVRLLLGAYASTSIN